MKQFKAKFREEISKDPDKYFATDVLRSEGFKRAQCKCCNKWYWSVNARNSCGDAACSGGFTFLGKARNNLDYISVWKRFSMLFKKWGYTPVNSYPVAARWRDDTDFVQASIYDFQPYVVNGSVKPPANPLVVPQFCLRFNDIDNVGITGSHFTGFVMIGQHAFVSGKDWDQEKYFTDIHNWLVEGLGLDVKEIIYHEDAWAGGGNFGPCMEFFSGGLELGNQVYMMYEKTGDSEQCSSKTEDSEQGNSKTEDSEKCDSKSGNGDSVNDRRELPIRVLDMGMGHERNAWFCKGSSTSYEAVFPTVCEMLRKKTGIKVDSGLMKKYLPYAAYLNIDEVEDIDKSWKFVAEKVGISVSDLKEYLLPLSAMYSIGDHTRSLLFALNDGVLPSNTGGGYNLRVLLRRCLSFIDKYEWNIDIYEVMKEHAKYLKPIFKFDNLDEIEAIIDNEKEKYKNTKEKTKILIEKIINEKIDEEKLISLYDSQGISPEMIAEEAKKLGKEVKIPENFYSKVSSLHQEVKKEKKENKIDFEDETKILYYDYQLSVFDAKVKYVKDNLVVLDKTVFYPTSGGQDHDEGYLETVNGKQYAVTDVIKQGSMIIHLVDGNFKIGDKVTGKINKERRIQLTQHHTAAHVINAAAVRVLGKHVNQAGAKKSLEKGHLDITHYRAISEEEQEAIEKEANKIVEEGIEVRKYFLSRDSAEKKFGMRIYQGGAVPGNELRIVEIPEVDVEACGGTHVDNTKELELIKILKTTKISDSIVRIVYTAGKMAQRTVNSEQEILKETAKILECLFDQIPGRAEELFKLWKEVKKSKKKGKELPDTKLKSEESFNGDVLAKTAEILKTQPEHVVKTLKRFKGELDF